MPDLNEQKRVAEIAGKLLSEECRLREIGLLYNHAADDSRQFTRWQMSVAMLHGWNLAVRAHLREQAR